MPARRTTARFSLAAALIGALAIAGAAAPASALGEPDGLYSAMGGPEGGTFVQLDKVDASETFLGEQEGYYFDSVEVVNGLGYAIGHVDSFDGDAVYTWDIVTGDVLTMVPLVLPANAFPEGGPWALDTTLDGTLLTYLPLENDDTTINDWVVSVDPVSGAVTPLVNVEALDGDLYFEGIATNPVDGVTYLLSDLNDSIPGAVPVDLAAGTLGVHVQYPEIVESLGGGYISEGDFDAAGTLWFTYGDSVNRTDGPLEVAVEAIELGTPEISNKAITIGQTIVLPQPEPGPQLAATGLELAPVAGGAALLLALGGVLLVARRRAQA